MRIAVRCQRLAVVILTQRSRNDPNCRCPYSNQGQAGSMELLSCGKEVSTFKIEISRFIYVNKVFISAHFSLSKSRASVHRNRLSMYSLEMAI